MWFAANEIDSIGRNSTLRRQRKKINFLRDRAGYVAVYNICDIMSSIGSALKNHDWKMWTGFISPIDCFRH